jgi:hypothetical protein
MSGFSSAGAGQLIGPNGNTMDTEEFLSGLNIFGVAGNQLLQVTHKLLTYSE